MDIEEIRARSSRLRDEIQELVDEFEKGTDCKLTSLGLDQRFIVEMNGAEHRYINHVELSVKLWGK